MRTKLYLIPLLLFFSFTISGQSIKDFPKGLGIDLEIGHNELNWELDYLRTSRNEIFISINGKLFYKFRTLGDFYLEPFVGYTRFGGKTPEQANGYKDEVKIDAIQTGFFVLYNTNFFNIDVGLGYKTKKMNSAILEQYGEFENQEAPREWQREDLKPLLDAWSHNIGFRIALTYDNFRFGIESWIGLNDLKDDLAFEEADLGGGTLTENHYRFIIGFVW